MNLATIWQTLSTILILILFSFSSLNTKAKTLSGDTHDISIPELDYAFTAVQDQQGYIWFGNRTGLHQFDGYRLKTFALNHHDLYANTQVRALAIDNEQNIWVGTSAGLNRYNPNTQTIEQVTNQYWQGANHLDISSIVIDQHGILWMATIKFGLFTYNPKTNVFRSFPLTGFENSNKPKPTNEAWDVKIDANNNLWVGTLNGLYLLKYDQQSQKTTPVKKFTTQNSELLSNNVINLHIDHHQNIWIGTSKGLNYYHSSTQKISSVSTIAKEQNPLAQVNISSFTRDLQGRLWISTWGKGVHIISVKQQNKLNQQQGFTLNTKLPLNSFQYENSPSDDIKSNNIYHLLADNNGLMWIIGDNGIKLMRSNSLEVSHQRYLPDFPISLADNSIIEDSSTLPMQTIKYTFEDSKGYQWFASGNGLSRYNRETQSYRYMFYQTANKDNLPTSHCVTIFEDNQERVWVGTQIGISVFDIKTNQFTEQVIEQFKANELNLTHSESLDSCAVQSITQDKNNNIWIANQVQFIKYDYQSNRFSAYHLKTLDGHIDHRHDVITSGYDGDNTIWLAKAHLGLGKFDIQTKQLTYFQKVKGSPRAEVNDILIENKNTIWLATDKGLWLFDGKDKFNQFISTSSNTSSFKSLALDNANNIWIGTNKGLKSFNSDTKTFREYHKTLGLLNDEYREKAAFKAKDGRLYFTGTKGVDYFDPQRLIKNSAEQSQQVILTDFILANQSVEIKTTQDLENRDNTLKTLSLDKAINLINELTLEHFHNLFKFEFSTLDYLHLNQTQYAFRLKGFDDNWIETDSNNRQGTFINVPAGNYTFEVKARKQDQPWSNIKALPIEILPPWWQTKLAYGLYLMVFIGALWLSYRWRTKNIMQINQKLEQQVIERTKTISKLMAQKDQMFANISHEFRTPLTLILNPIQRLIDNQGAKGSSLTLEQTKHSHQSIKQNAQRLLRMVEQLLEFAKTEHNNQQTGLKNYSLKYTIDYLIACFDSLFSSKNITVSVNEYQDVHLTLTPDSLEIILSNLISNAVKYTPKGGTIEIIITTKNNQITISVKDNGIGIAKDYQQKVFERFGRVEQHQADTQASTGIGLALVKELVSTNHGKIELNSAPNKGSCFTITLPIKSSTENTEHENTHREISNNSKQITALEVSSLTNITQQQPSRLSHLNDESNDESNNIALEDTKDSQTTKSQVLVIDDNQELLELMHDIISPHFNCILATNGEQGLKKAREHLPDIVISDLMMPGISGFEVLKNLKSDQLTAHIPVIMLTAKGDAQSRIEGWNNKADEYLAKPFNDQELIARISNILAIRRIISNRYQQLFVQGQISSISPNDEPQADENQLDKVAAAFSQQLEQVLTAHYQDENVTITTIAKQMALSTRQLTRKTKSIIGMTPIESLRTYRLNKAAELLGKGQPPSSIAFEVGFASHSYFTACFKAHFGCTPSGYKKKR